MQDQREAVTFYLPKQQVDEVEAEAQRQQSNRSVVARQVFQSWIQERQKQQTLATQKGG